MVETNCGATRTVPTEDSRAVHSIPCLISWPAGMLEFGRIVFTARHTNISLKEDFTKSEFRGDE